VVDQEHRVRSHPPYNWIYRNCERWYWRDSCGRSPDRAGRECRAPGV